jgi:hypothetical protein
MRSAATMILALLPGQFDCSKRSAAALKSELLYFRSGLFDFLQCEGQATTNRGVHP